MWKGARNAKGQEQDGQWVGRVRNGEADSYKCKFGRTFVLHTSQLLRPDRLPLSECAGARGAG